jgi:hypothetical protein
MDRETASSTSSEEEYTQTEGSYLFRPGESAMGVVTITRDEEMPLDWEYLPPTSSTDENYVNQRRVEQLRKELTNELLTLIREGDFEYGLDTRADVLVRQQIAQNTLATKDWLNRLFLENFQDVPVTVSLLHIIARLDYLTIYPEGQTMAIAALSHKNVEVKECGVRAFEAWEALGSLRVLDQLNVSTPWLQEYIDEVVRNLRTQHNVPVCQENR